MRQMIPARLTAAALVAAAACGSVESKAPTVPIEPPPTQPGSAPVLPAQLLAYSDARVPLPRHLTIVPGIPGTDTSAEAHAVASNPTTDAGATLGRVLFYDRRLSVNQTVS